MGELSKLKGLGPRSEKCLNEIGIHTRVQLSALGPVQAYIKLTNECSIKPSLNFLYAMVGALEDRHWADIARSERRRLIFELQDFAELENILQAQGLDIGTKL